jgi:phage tail-like protein
VARTAERHDPALGFRFEVTLGGQSAGGFSECTGLQLETEVHDYAEGGLNTHVHKLPTRTKQTNLTLKRGVVDRQLWEWYAEIIQGQFSQRTGAVLVHDPSGAQVLAEWEFLEAFPCKWVGPDLNATQGSVAVETFELCHQGLNRKT